MFATIPNRTDESLHIPKPLRLIRVHLCTGRVSTTLFRVITTIQILTISSSFGTLPVPFSKAVHFKEAIPVYLSYLRFCPLLIYLVKSCNDPAAPARQHRQAHHIRYQMASNPRLWSGSKWDLFPSHQSHRPVLRSLSRYAQRLMNPFLPSHPHGP